MMEEDTRKLHDQFKKVKVKEDREAHDKNLYKAHGSGQDTGTYQLVGVVTHKGRTAKSGHYKSYVHKSGGKQPFLTFLDDWLEFDDDDVSPSNIDEVMNLKGGSDGDIAYILLYRKLEI